MYHYGCGAYEAWAADLRRLRYPADLDAPQPEGSFDCFSMGNMATQLQQVAVARSAAAEFCETAAAQLRSPAAAEALARAAERDAEASAEAARAAAAQRAVHAAKARTRRPTPS